MKSQRQDVTVSDKANNLLAICPTENDFQMKFAVINTFDFVTKGKDRMITGNAPTLTTVMAAYNKSAAIDWINSILLDYAVFCGKADKSNAYQIDSIAQTIIMTYKHLKVTEILLCFSMMKGGQLQDKRGDDAAKMYGAFSGQAIMAAMRVFMDYRAIQIDRLNKVNYEEQWESAKSTFVQPLLKQMRLDLEAKSKAEKEKREKEKERLIKEHNEQFLKMLESRKFINK